MQNGFNGGLLPREAKDEGVNEMPPGELGNRPSLCNQPNVDEEVGKDGGDATDSKDNPVDCSNQSIEESPEKSDSSGWTQNGGEISEELSYYASTDDDSDPESVSNGEISGSSGEDPSGLSNEEEIPEDVKREMLPSICKGVVTLTRESQAAGGCSYVYLVGTAHVSKESCKEVQAVTSFLKPEVVFLELCEKRRFLLTTAEFEVPTLSEMLNSWKQKRSNLLGVIYSWFLAKVASKMEVFPGSEFRIAYQEAKACGAKVVLGDRDVQITLRRTWGRMSLWYRVKFIFGLVFQAIALPSAEELQGMIEQLQDADMFTVAFRELGKSFPTVMETLVAERDMFMTAVLQKVAEKHSSVVAVVGKGHVPGIKSYWEQEISVKSLMEVPSRVSFWTTIPKYYILVPVFAVSGALLLRVYHHSFST